MKVLIMVLVSICGLNVVSAEVLKYSIDFNIPYSMPQGKFKKTTLGAVGYGGAGDLSVSEGFAIGAEIEQIHYKQKDFNDPVLGAWDTYPGALVTYFGLRIKTSKPVDFGSEKGRIYGVLGLGSYSVLDTFSALRETSESLANTAQIETSAIGFNIGGGLDVELAPQWFLGFSLRYHMINKDYHILNPGIRIAYAFGPIVEPTAPRERKAARSFKRTARTTEPELSEDAPDEPEAMEEEDESRGIKPRFRIYQQESEDSSEVLPEEDGYQSYLNKAAGYIAQQDHAKAEQAYVNALANLSDDDGRKVYAYERCGYMAVKQKAIVRARNYYLAAILAAKKLGVYDKHAVNAYCGLAYCFEKKGNIPTAIKNYEKALDLTADDGVARKITTAINRLRSTFPDSQE